MHARKPTGKAPVIVDGQTHDGRLAVNAREAAALLGIGETMTYALIGDGRLPSVKVGERRLISIKTIERILAGEVSLDA